MQDDNLALRQKRFAHAFPKAGFENIFDREAIWEQRLGGNIFSAADRPGHRKTHPYTKGNSSGTI